MTHYDILNGDADGLCALVQLRLQQPAETTLVTGVKRDIWLLDRIKAGPGDRLTVLDISLDSNRNDLQRILVAGAQVETTPHRSPITRAGRPHRHRLGRVHQPARRPASCRRAASMGHRRRLRRQPSSSARQLAATTTFSAIEIVQLQALGEALNYNAYGEAVADLRYPHLKQRHPASADFSHEIYQQAIVRLSANHPDGTGDPAFRVEQAANQEFHEGSAGAGRHGHQEKGNPFREQQANRGGKRHEGVSERENFSLVAALLAPKSTPGEQRGDPRNRMSCQVFFALF